MLRLCSVVAEAGLYVREKHRQPQEENNSRPQHRMDTSRQLSQSPTSSGSDLGTAKVVTGVSVHVTSAQVTRWTLCVSR